MNLEDIIKTRRSVRKFSDRRLEPGVLEKIIAAANFAPSHCNTQGWKFIFVDDYDLRFKIFNNGGSHVIKAAPYGILVLYDTTLSDNLEYQDWIQSLRNIFDIPANYSPVAYVAFGYSDQPVAAVLRKNNLTEILATNKFIWPAEKLKPATRCKRIVRKIYFLMPAPFKKMIQPLANKFVKKFHN